MSVLRNFGAVFLLGCGLAASVSIASDALAAERRAIVTEGADYFGQDYKTLKEVDLSDCEAACVGDTGCKAFTYNTKVRWCFMKSTFGDLKSAEGAVAGRIVTSDIAGPDLEAKRLAQLTYVDSSLVDEARRLVGDVDGVTVEGSFEDILNRIQDADSRGNNFQAIDLLKMALRLAPERSDLWAGFAVAATNATSNDWQTRNNLQRDATAAAINAYLRSISDADAAHSLNVLSAALAKRELWRPAIKAARASLAIAANADLSQRLDRLVAEHGFRVVENSVETQAASPRICLALSDPLAAEQGDIGDFVTVNGGHQFPVEAQGKQICVDGVGYGERYHVTLRPGLKAEDGEALVRAADLDIYVRDRDPQVRFLGKAYVLPAGGEATLPIVTINVDTIEARLVRIGDRSLAGTIADEQFLSQLSKYDIDQIADQTGEPVWQGKVDVTRDLNREVTTAIPVGELVKSLKPGVYVLSARNEGQTSDWQPDATQWFIVTDIGISGLTGDDGLHVFARSLSTAKPVSGARLSLIAVNNDVLGTVTTSTEGYARFDAGLVRGTGGLAPALVVAQGAEGDYSFLDLKKSAFDLTDRGVDGRPAPGPVDVFMTAERGVYRPGESVHLTALSRNSRAEAIGDLPLTIVIRRPDGVEAQRSLLADKGLGGHDLTYAVADDAMRGTWQVAAYTDPKSDPVASTSFLVEDFVPERLTFDLKPPFDAFDRDNPGSLPIEARYLYGAPAGDLTVEGTVQIKAAPNVPGLPGVVFGLADETFEPQTAYLDSTATDADGKADVMLAAPDIAQTSKPLEAQITVQVTDTSGRPVERQTTLPVKATSGRIGIAPLFDGSVEEGGNARFQVLAVNADDRQAEAKGLSWTLEKVDRHFQWYKVDGSWNYEPVELTKRVANGTVDASADSRPTIESAVEWGEYKLTVTDPSGQLLPASTTFDAGWYVEAKAADTPDALKVSLDKEKYKVGETVKARIETRFAGVALVTVIDNRLIAMKTVEVPLEGATVELPVTPDWGPGAYVAATLIRPMDLNARRMPARALGLTYAGVDPEGRKLDVEITTPEKPTPRAPLPVDVKLANLESGTEAYVTIAAVDVGILNLTAFETPAPDSWYFGQRRLGMEIRDLYGQLIDRMIGVKGEVRSGGDGAGLSSFKGTPPTEKLVSFYQGVTKVRDDGTVHVNVDIPDFNGTVRVMVMAWSKAGVGHGEKDVVIRDPVVVNASLPAFMAPGDSSRIALDVTHLDGPAGAMKVAVTSQDGLVSIDQQAGTRSFDLANGGKTQLLMPITARTVGDAAIDVALTTPDGKELVKHLTLGIRANDPPAVHESTFDLVASNGRLTLGADLFNDFVPGSAGATVIVGGPQGIDLPGLVRSLDRYPYGCAEQITSKALPLVYLDDVITAAGLTGETPVRERVNQAIKAVLADQSASGSFGLWGPGSGDMWLDAYVTDFLTRAREKDYDVPAVAFDLAVTNLANQMSYVSDFSDGGEGVAYALYVLARNGRASIGDLRYYAEAKLDNFATPLAKAQIGAALALYGDGPRASAVFRNAVSSLGGSDHGGYRSDYGSMLRDGAAILTLVSETKADALDTGKLARDIVAAESARRYTSTQEKAWMLLAANAMLSGDAKPKLAINGNAYDGVFSRSFSREAVRSQPIEIENRTDRALQAKVSVRGAPVTPEPAGGNGYAISRQYFDLDGYEVDPAAIQLGERLVTVLTVTSTTSEAARLVVDDPLPAGFAIDNPNLLASADLTKIPGLDVETAAARTEFRADRFVAALDRSSSSPTQFKLAYMVRAIAPGAFAHPAALVEDMYRPEKRGWTDTGKVEVIGPLK
ncbi:hypothetical protein HDIA_2768 [Hartmannibacter diazotrophicus]|uniref:Apple domain-containing protein n=1 Tax=Hartmannibacter diazotrophicus TaxID=1482074 RepID=A0A2C9D802_9HYPH|nr:alpha-2-macroglobulin family protein [Hartmannibacter diazotrophicus]SON56309.1 hypothetical protein HDIA_2768 [Hartmannibacter diazotrophicus]